MSAPFVSLKPGVAAFVPPEEAGLPSPDDPAGPPPWPCSQQAFDRVAACYGEGYAFSIKPRSETVFDLRCSRCGACWRHRRGMAKPPCGCAPFPPIDPMGFLREAA